MDYRLIAVSIVAAVINSSVYCSSYETEGFYSGSHSRFIRQAPDQKCSLQLRRPSANYSQLFEFGETFTRLMTGLEKIKSTSGDVIMFVGNTGAGKSSLVHILAGNTANFIAEDPSETADYQIVDLTNKYVSKITTSSTTIYPEAIVDKDSGVVFFDTPGFRDTRSVIHEVVTMYGLKAVAKNSKHIKFALLVNHNSLTSAGTRDDFTNTLKSYLSLLHNPKKFTTYLVATKVENRKFKKKGVEFNVSDDTIVAGIVEFLKNVQQVFKSQQNNNQLTSADEQYLSQAQSFIQDLIDHQERIALFRKPDEEGPIMNSATIRQSLAAIRQTLLTTNGYTDVDINDFGYTLSEKAGIYIRDLFDLMNNYITDVSKLFTMSFEQFMVVRYKTFVDIAAITTSLAATKHDADVLIQSVNASQTPDQFANALYRFVASLNVDSCGNETYKEIKQLTEFLSSVKNVNNKNMYTPSKWADSLFDIERTVKSEQDYYVMLKSLFEKLTAHTALNDDFFSGTALALKKYDDSNMMVDEQHYPVLMEHLGLKQFAGLKMNQDRLKAINSIYLKAYNQQARSSKSFCKNKTLVIVGNFLQLQTLDKNKIASCVQATTVALLATNKIYIDSNIGVDVLGGRNLVIIAPEWQVMGKFMVSVDGASRGSAEPKAFLGQVGNDGKPGQSAGKFIGVALRYFNSEQLIITANGGRGQDGQAGGDGVDGRDGSDGSSSSAKKIDSTAQIYVLYNRAKSTSLIEAEKGSQGGDAGMGGNGGAGGFSGQVEMHSLTKEHPDRSNHLMLNGDEGLKGANGKPGHGGLRGCDATIKETKSYILFIPAGTSSTHEYVSCERKNANGQLVSNQAKYSEAPEPVPEPPKVCDLYRILSAHFPEMNNIFSHKLFKEFQHVFKEKFHCNA